VGAACSGGQLSRRIGDDKQGVLVLQGHGSRQGERVSMG
jgi:hypothetical protein